MSRTTRIFITVSIIILITNITFADWKDNAKVIDMSGGEDHTLVLTANKWPWGCGDNRYSQLGIGDADCKTYGSRKYRVYVPDLTILVNNWKKTIDDLTLNPCADFDHKPYGARKYRVFNPDLTILIDNWKKKDADLPGNCASCDRGQRASGSGLTTKEMLAWLAELWLDPEVREHLDEDTWLKFVESIKNEM